MFWCIRIDNEKVNSIGSLNGKMFLTCTVYANERNGELYEMKKYNLWGNRCDNGEIRGNSREISLKCKNKIGVLRIYH